MSKTPERLKLWWKSPRGCYHKHKFNAKHRGVPFLLTFEEWWSIWDTSGKWKQRGRGRGEYLMSRFGDIGAYEVGNVEIRLASENVAERNRNHPMSAEQASVRSKRGWAKISEDERSRLGTARQAKRVNFSYSEESRAKMRASAKRVLSGRVRNEHGQWATPEDAEP